MRHAARSSPVQQRPLTVGSIVACPETDCDQLAEIVDAWTWPSTSGPVAHGRTRCLARHVFTPRLESIVPAAVHAPSGSGDRAASHA
jgi:hypothetical protein